MCSRMLCAYVCALSDSGSAALIRQGVQRAVDTGKDSMVQTVPPSVHGYSHEHCCQHHSGDLSQHQNLSLIELSTLASTLTAASD